MRAVLVSRAVRSFAYGALTVALAQALSARGFSPLGIGAAITLALVAGAATSALTGRFVRTVGARATMAAAGIAMVLAALLLAGSAPAIVAACLLGVVSPGAQDVGPFAAIEQTEIAIDGDGTTRRLAAYNVLGAAGVAFGALAAAVVAYPVVLAFYGIAGASAAFVARTLRDPEPRGISPAAAGGTPSRAVERLAALFAVDAFAGGFIVQAFVAYWFSTRFGVGPSVVGPLLFGANALAAASYLLAARVASRFGLLNTMVFTHLPSNVLLCVLPFMPSLTWAATVLLLRFALSQMDVPTRQAYTFALVEPHERARAAGITAAVRPAAASVAPVLSGVAFQLAASGLPFVLAGLIKIAYDVALLATFRNVRPDGAARNGA